jgi:hypothetical protein
VIEAGIYALLAADAGVSALVAGRIFQGVAPSDQSQYPCVVCSFVGGSSEPTFQGAGMIRQRVQIDAFAAVPSGTNSPGTVAANIRAAVIRALNGWQQTALDDGTFVSSAVLLNPGTDFVSEQRIFRCMCEFYVLFTIPNL